MIKINEEKFEINTEKIEKNMSKYKEKINFVVLVLGGNIFFHFQDLLIQFIKCTLKFLIWQKNITIPKKI